ncbi:MAG: hypothetical protein IKI11_09570 [Neisseriaceae bacterium]|nr:hypothetical protein [Neisseriaceae bacterium]
MLKSIKNRSRKIAVFLWEEKVSGCLKPLQNWHLWQISSLGLRSKS